MNRHPKISHHSRLVQREGRRTKIYRNGIRRLEGKDFYVSTISSSWPKLIFGIVVLYFATNSLFASLYLIQHGSIENAHSHSFTDAFFFSVQTLATIGYGKMAPATMYANILVAIEALVGLGGLAIATGVIFSKISRPSARVLFGNVALISKYKGKNCFMFRLGNLRSGQVADPMIKAVLICDEFYDGVKRRTFNELPLMVDHMPLLMPSWTAKHVITKDSPLFGLTKDNLGQKNIEIIVSITGFDETLSQTVHSHHSYITSEIIFGGKFVDIISWDKKRRIHVNYKKFHDIEKLSASVH
jgi:inward rectifier potassium channel